MTDRVTLEQLDYLDAAIALAEAHVRRNREHLRKSIEIAETLRAEQARAVAAYNRQAARPLTP